MSQFFVGLDLGQAQDYTALSVIERIGESADDYRYDVRHLQRFALGTTYPAIVEAVAKMCQSKPIASDYSLVADATGVGAAVMDLLEASGLSLTRVTITGGDTVSQEGSHYRVPKRDLVGVLQVLL